MKKAISVISCIVFLGLMLVFSGAAASHAQLIDPGLQTLLDSLGPDDEVDVLVTLSDQVDIKKVKDKYKDNPKAELRTALVTELKDKKDKTQKVIKDLLAGKAVKVTSLWIFNGLAVTAAKQVILDLADQPGIESIRLDDILFRSDSLSADTAAASSVPEWNLDAIRAPEIWALGHTGSGIVVATMDTGADAGHLDLGPRWRGGSNSWYDPNGQHATPYDSDGHGTQVLGVIVGGDATGKAIGVAPGVQWIAVKIFSDAGSASYSGIHLGFQWLMDPDDNPGTNDPPDVVNNSWGFGQLANQCFTEFRQDIQALKAAEIGVVFSAGNGGPTGYTSESPANYPESFAVGALNADDSIASFSSRGPSSCDGGIYPQATAPGVGIRTAGLTYGGSYPNTSVAVSGTSIAAPHVSGAMAILLGAFPSATVAELELATMESALDLGATFADNAYGYGLVDVAEAYVLLMQGRDRCADVDGDGSTAGDACGGDCDDSDPYAYPNAPETKHDGIDQDCNGYDLTIDIILASYTAATDTLVVEATSELGVNALLELEGYGPMKWNRKKGKWTITVALAGGNPGTVTVTGVEGTESAQTASGGDTGGSEGKAQTCSDGIDNDGDGLTDCADPGCSKNNACR